MALYTATVAEDGSIAIPTIILDQMGIMVDDFVQLESDEFGITLTKLSSSDAVEKTDVLNVATREQAEG